MKLECSVGQARWLPCMYICIKTLLLDAKINQGSEYYMYKQIVQDYLAIFNLCKRDFRVARCDADQSDNGTYFYSQPFLC